MNINQILAEREKTHGNFSEQADISQQLKSFLHKQTLRPIQKESLQMILHKVARILVGNPDEADHWDDIAGYAILVSQWLKENNNPNTKE